MEEGLLDPGGEVGVELGLPADVTVVRMDGGASEVLSPSATASATA